VLGRATAALAHRAFPSSFLLCHLVRLYGGPEFDFDVQLVLRKEDVPECRMAAGDDGPRLGWNTWMRSQPLPRDADEAAFAGEEVVWVGPAPAGLHGKHPRFRTRDRVTDPNLQSN
jgi:predicted component of type VI protein secretion system